MRYRVRTHIELMRTWVVTAASEDEAHENFFTGEIVDVDEWPEEVEFVEEIDE